MGTGGTVEDVRSRNLEVGWADQTGSSVQQAPLEVQYLRLRR